MNMFRAAATEPAAVEVPSSSDLIPLSVLALDLDLPGSEGWPAYLEARAVAVVVDDVGRDSVSRADAGALLAERRETVAREREAAARRLEQLEREAAERDRERRAQIWKGVPASAFPDGVSAASVLVAAIRDSQPKRESVLDAALSNAGEITFHSLAPTEDES